MTRPSAAHMNVVWCKVRMDWRVHACAYAHGAHVRAHVRVMLGELAQPVA